MYLMYRKLLSAKKLNRILSQLYYIYSKYTVYIEYTVKCITFTAFDSFTYKAFRMGILYLLQLISVHQALTLFQVS